MSGAKKLLIAVWLLAMVVLHQDNWLWHSKYLVFGFLPAGLAYHAAYSLLASLGLWWLVCIAWPTRLEDDVAGAPKGQGSHP